MGEFEMGNLKDPAQGLLQLPATHPGQERGEGKQPGHLLPEHLCHQKAAHGLAQAEPQPDDHQQLAFFRRHLSGSQRPHLWNKTSGLDTVQGRTVLYLVIGMGQSGATQGIV